MKKKFLFIILVFVSNILCSQNETIDSMQKVLQTQKEDTNKAKLFISIGKEYMNNSEFEESITYLKEGLSLSEKLNFKPGQGNAFHAMGMAYNHLNNYPEALKNNFNALKIREETGDKKGMAGTYNNIGLIYHHLGNYSSALSMYYKALKINEKIGNKAWMAANYNNIGIICTSQKQYNEALKNFKKCLNIREELGDRPSQNHPYNNMGNVYFEEGNYTEALKNFKTALEIRIEMGDQYEIGNSLGNIGATYEKLRNYGEAMKNHFASLKIADEIDNKDGKATAYINIGNIKVKMKEYAEARLYFDSCFAIGKEIGSLEVIKIYYENLTDLDSAQGNYKQSFADYRLFILHRDSLLNDENKKQLVQQEMQYDFDKKEEAIKAEEDKKRALANAEIQKQKIVRNFSFAGIFVVILIGGYGFYRFRKNKKLENQQSLLNERLRISRELHDDMGSTLSSISVYSEVAKNRASKNENETEVLQKIGTASRELIEKMSDIVWSLNPNNENFEQLKNRMMAFAAMMLTPKGILFEFDIDDEVKNASIAPEQRKNIFLIYKEAINNIVKYSEAKEVKVKVKVKENKLSLEVIDNGKGFDTDNIIAYNGNGLKNMRARAEEIKALFNVNSRINEGTGIELSFNL